MGNHRSLGICQCLQKKPLPGMSVVPDVRGWKGRGDSCGAAPHRCWWKESCGRPAQGDLCGAAHRPCASALLTHSGRRRPPCCPLENTRETFSVPLRLEILVRQGMSAPSCVFASLSPGCNSWEGRRPKASDRVANHI